MGVLGGPLNTIGPVDGSARSRRYQRINQVDATLRPEIAEDHLSTLGRMIMGPGPNLWICSLWDCKRTLAEHNLPMSLRCQSISTVHPLLDIYSSPATSRKMLSCKSDPSMVKSYQMRGQRLKRYAAGHVLLAFLGVFGLFRLFSNYSMFLMLEYRLSAIDMVLTDHRQICSSRDISTYPDNRQGDDDLRVRQFDIRENFGDA
jgi:hypothetical protein